MIETDRLMLRPFRMEDAADVFEYLEKPIVNCFACMKLNTLDDAKAETIKIMGIQTPTPVRARSPSPSMWPM